VLGETLRRLAVLACAFVLAACDASLPTTSATPAPTAPPGASATAPIRASASAPASPSVAPVESVLPSPSVVPSPATVPSPSPSAAATATGAFGFRAKGMSHEVIAFATVPQLAYAAGAMDLTAISTIAFFGLTATASGGLDLSNTGGRAWSSDTMSRVIARAHAAGTRVVATIGRFSWDAAGTRTSRALLSSAAARQRLADTVARVITARGADGVDLDFEPIPSGLGSEYGDLVGRVRRALDARRPGLQLTVALVGHFDSYDVPAIVRGKPDALYLMGYHYAGWWSKIAGSTAPLGGPRYDLVDTVRLLRRYAPADRIIVGIPYYGHLWPTSSGGLHAATTGRGTDLRVTTAAALAAQHGVRWDAVEHGAWSRWQVRDCSTCPLHWVQVYFDSPRAVADKWAWIKRDGLLGTGIWTIGFEGEPGPWNAELRRAFVAR
jgi:spore germination protein YaaH